MLKKYSRKFLKNSARLLCQLDFSTFPNKFLIVSAILYKRFLSGPLVLLEPSTNSVLFSLCCSQSTMLSSYNSLCNSEQCCLSGCFALFQQWSAQLQIVLFIRLLCSLPTTVCVTVRNIICQVTLLPFFTGSLHCCVSDHSAPFLHQQFALLCIRLLPSFTSSLYCYMSGCSALFLQQ